MDEVRRLPGRLVRPGSFESRVVASPGDNDISKRAQDWPSSAKSAISSGDAPVGLELPRLVIPPGENSTSANAQDRPRSAKFGASPAGPWVTRVAPGWDYQPGLIELGPGDSARLVLPSGEHSTHFLSTKIQLTRL